MKVQFFLSLILILLSWSSLAQDPGEILARQVSDAQSIHQSWIKAQSKGVSKKDIFEGQSERADYIISGIPKFVKNFNPSGVVFRHYTGQATQIILETNQLKTGINPTFMKIKILRYSLNGKTITL